MADPGFQSPSVYTAAEATANLVHALYTPSYTHPTPSLTHTHAHTLSFRIYTITHTHTHTPSLSFKLYTVRAHTLTLLLYKLHTIAHTHTRPHSFKLYTITHPLFKLHTISHTHTHTPSLSELHTLAFLPYYAPINALLAHHTSTTHTRAHILHLHTH